jgi:hypothetical protein
MYNNLQNRKKNSGIIPLHFSYFMGNSLFDVL